MTIKLDKNVGMLVLSVWLILTGLKVVDVDVDADILNVLAIGAGVLLLVQRGK